MFNNILFRKKLSIDLLRKFKTMMSQYVVQNDNFLKDN